MFPPSPFGEGHTPDKFPIFGGLLQRKLVERFYAETLRSQHEKFYQPHGACDLNLLHSRSSLTFGIRNSTNLADRQPSVECRFASDRRIHVRLSRGQDA